MSKIDIEKLEKEIVERLKPLDPDKIILFGSYAYGEPNEESDIDLYIVTKDEYLPKNWREKSDLVVLYSQRLADMYIHFPLDIIVHTKKMHQKFVESKSSFSKTILQQGKVIYEHKDSHRVA